MHGKLHGNYMENCMENHMENDMENDMEKGRQMHHFGIILRFWMQSKSHSNFNVFLNCLLVDFGSIWGGNGRPKGCEGDLF